MNYERFEYLYRYVPKYQKDQLKNFRKIHPALKTTVNGIEWEYFFRKNPEKENLLMLTGSTRKGENYALFHKMEKYFQVISPTYPNINSFSKMVEGISDFLEKLNIKHCSAIGSSLGGIILQQFIRLHPDKIRRLVICNCSASSLDLYKHIPITTLIQILPKVIIKRKVKKKFKEMVGEIPEKDQAFWDAYCEELGDGCVTRKWLITIFKFFSVFGKYSLHYTPNDLIKWSGKMLIINSEKDVIFNQESQLRLQKIYPKAIIHTISNAGHVPSVSHGDEFTKVIIAFLTEKDV